MTCHTTQEREPAEKLPPTSYSRIAPCVCGIYLLSAEHCTHVRAGLGICPQCVERLA